MTALEIRLAKALTIIEAMAMHGDPDDPALGQIYTIAHRACGTCASPMCQKFDESITELAATFKSDKTVDVDEHVAEIGQRWETAAPSKTAGS